MQFTMAQEAGKKAAEYVINRYPSLFPWKQPIPVDFFLLLFSVLTPFFSLCLKDLRNQYIRNKEVTLTASLTTAAISSSFLLAMK